MPIAIERCPEFVGRTTNWLYDHLRFLPGYCPVVLCNRLVNRNEFCELTAWAPPSGLARRLWKRWRGHSLYPTELHGIRQMRPAVLHSHFGRLALGDTSLQEALGLPWIVSFYGADVYQGTKRVLASQYRTIFDKAARVLALGPSMAKRLVELGCPEEKVVIHPLGVDLHQLPVQLRSYDRRNPLRVLFAGTFREKKGIEYLLDAVAEVARDGYRVHLRLVGGPSTKDGDAATALAVAMRLRKLPKRCVVVRSPYLRFNELIEAALESDVFVAPSVTAANGDSEGTPFVLQQMMATGMPVIATRHSDIPFIFGPYEDLLVTERDATAIAERLRRYVEQPQLVFEHGQAMRRQIESLDASHCARRLRDIYDQVRPSKHLAPASLAVASA